ncbi:MAG: hypothetical protein DRG37_06290 [Deltaproteobacteria bacterium]|nr:MAG: hypothetical protein DRG37_06290 [Deltaproteobacteria bacterium]
MFDLVFILKAGHGEEVFGMNIYGSKELMEDVISRDMCIGCGACNYLCPYFRPYRGKVAMLFPCDIDKGRCWAYCPKAEVDLEELSKTLYGKAYKGDPLGSYEEIRISRAGPRMVTKGDFQAGGTVSSIISLALKKGYISSAVLTDRKGILPVPRIVTSPEEVLECSTSKYTAAPTLAAFNQAVKDGYRNIGVVGTPCQVLAVAQMRSNPMEDNDFEDPTGLVLGLFCTWALDYRAFERFITKRVDIERIKKVDIPPPPAEIMEVYSDDGAKMEIPLDEVRKLVPETCSYCTDMTSEFADISVGVLEGRPDMNTLIVRTKRGKAIVDEAVREGFLVVEDMPEENLEHLRWAAGNKKQRALRKLQEAGLVNTSNGKRSILRLSPKTLKGIIA